MPLEAALDNQTPPESPMQKLVAVTLIQFALTGLACAQGAATFSTQSLTPETALLAARAGLESCRKQGFQVVHGNGWSAVDRRNVQKK